MPEPVEDGATFEQNAIKKVEYFCGRLGYACVADDSGLVVDALDGAPGVYSARYAGEGATDLRNLEKLLRELAGVPEPRRTARFVCCAAFLRPCGQVHIEKGIVEGRIAFDPRGTGGFGYDPVFVPLGDTRTFGEFPSDEKHAISHRGNAFRQLRAYLEQGTAE